MAFEFSEEQLKFLGKSDKTDPYILSRMPGEKPPLSYFTNPSDLAIAKRFSQFQNDIDPPKTEQKTVTEEPEATALSRGLKAKSTDESENANQNLAVKNTAEPPGPIDWRVKLSLSNNSSWLYNAQDAYLLKPLINTNGVIFPYTPTIQMGYKANYDSPDITHTNYKLNFYRNSYVDDITLTADFTAQDTVEANYLFAVMHFFKSATKMFYGADKTPPAGTPPPLLFLSGYGKDQFKDMPLLLSSFTYTLPNDVDYIRTNTDTTWSGTSITRQESSSKQEPAKSPVRDFLNSVKIRLSSNGLKPGAEKTPPKLQSTSKNLNNNNSSFVPTKIQLSLTLKPVVTRRTMSTTFSLQEYASGSELKGMW